MIENNGQVLFTEKELRCKGSGQLVLASGFADKLKELRLAMDQPMEVNSCCRSPEYNKHVGGHPRSLHLTSGGHQIGGTAAIDIGTRGKSNEYKARLARIALAHGWSVGVHPGFLHLDLRVQLTGKEQAIFNY